MAINYQMSINEFNQLVDEVEAAKHSNDPIDRAWLEFYQQTAIAYGLHPDALCASPVSF
jgi:hypothetical protein